MRTIRTPRPPEPATSEIGPYETHEVFNQPPPYDPIVLYRPDRAPMDAVHRKAGDAFDVERATPGADRSGTSGGPGALPGGAPPGGSVAG